MREGASFDVFEMGILSELNKADAFQNGHAGSSREMKMVEVSASASHMPDCRLASTSHLLDSNTIPCNMPDLKTALLNFLLIKDFYPRKIHALFDSKDVKGLQGIFARAGVILAFLIALLAFIYKLTAGR
ncbi:uncharacterized protein LOC131239315 [Magnolia sinica]|uniref:uncharacterized protein LOC131239315 n=1 Tax=Magnolia sinica TaxID=86752 RepID=UPI00265AF416|nr:uncharacterized protein LOC131239315 [Magnolia sinica]